MKDIKGSKIQILGFTSQKLGDLIYHEGPLLSLFLDNNNPDIYYLYKWADCNKEVNRWLVIQLNTINLRSFFYKEISLRTLILNTAFTYIVEIDDGLYEKNILISATNDLPEEYLPKENSMYDEGKYTEFSNNFKLIIENNRIYDMLNEVLREISVLKKSQTTTQKLINTLLNNPKKEPF